MGFVGRILLSYCILHPDALWKPHLRNHPSTTNLISSFLCVGVEKQPELVAGLTYPMN
jgi:hypothetical protein